MKRVYLTTYRQDKSTFWNDNFYQCAFSKLDATLASNGVPTYWKKLLQAYFLHLLPAPQICTHTANGLAEFVKRITVRVQPCSICHVVVTRQLISHSFLVAKLRSQATFKYQAQGRVGAAATLVPQPSWVTLLPNLYYNPTMCQVTSKNQLVNDTSQVSRVQLSATVAAFANGRKTTTTVVGKC